MKKVYKNTIETLAIFETLDADYIIITDSSRNYSDDSGDWSATYIIKDDGDGCGMQYAYNIYSILRVLKKATLIHYIHPDHMSILFEFLDDDYLEDDANAQNLLKELERMI